MGSKTPTRTVRQEAGLSVQVRTCPHFVILGAVGVARQIGHVVNPSSWDVDPPFELAEAIAEVRGTMT